MFFDYLLYYYKLRNKMINTIQNSKISSYVRLKNATEKHQANQPPSFKGGFTRLENGIFRTGGISVWDERAQHMITKSLNEKQLKNLMKYLFYVKYNIIYLYINYYI